MGQLRGLRMGWGLVGFWALVGEGGEGRVVGLVWARVGKMSWGWGLGGHVISGLLIRRIVYVNYALDMLEYGIELIISCNK